MTYKKKSFKTFKRDDIARTLAITPGQGRRAYILGGERYTEVFTLASRIIEECQDYLKGKSPICLVSSDKAFIMASIAASFAGGPDFVIPHSLSESVVAEACRMTGSVSVLSDKHMNIPKGIPNIVPHVKKGNVLLPGLRRDINRPFVWLYTGGSTGKPKLWPKTPINLIGEALNLKRTFNVQPDDIILAAVPPMHIYGLLFSVLLPFVSGAMVVADIPYFPQVIIRSIHRTRCTIFVGSPVHYKALAGASIGAGRLRCAFSSGGFLEEAHSIHFSKSTGVGVIEVFGSTETGGIATRCRAENEDTWRPFSLARWKVQKGRLCVSSPLISPNLRKDKKGFYTTGDMAEDNKDGTFILLGRADGIVKVAGKRVDLVEVEQKIKSLSFIKDAFVFSLSSKSGRGQEIAALIATNEDKAIVRKTLSRLLDPICVPKRFARVKAIPMTPAGKRDREKAERLLT